MTILKGYYLGQVRVIIWAKFVATQNGQLGPDNNPSIFCAHFFQTETVLKTPIV